MDNCTHTLCGLALARVGGDRLGPLATPTLVVAASLPDLDIVSQPIWGQAGYLLYHRGITHSVLGLAVESLLLAGLMTAFGRRRAPEDRPRFVRLWIAAALGLASHLLLDALNTYGVRPWLPFAETRYFGDVAFIIDPWLWLCFGSAACLGAPRPVDPRGSAGWWVFLALGTLFALGSSWLPWQTVLLWTPAMAGVLILRHVGVGAAHRRRTAGLLFVLALPYLGTLAVLDRAADARARAAVGAAQAAPVERSTCHPAPTVPWRFHVAVATAGRVYQVDVDLWAGRAELSPHSLPRGLDDPALPAVAGTFAHRAWRSFARIPFAGRDGRWLVLGDARYAPQPRRAWCNLLVPLPPGPEVSPAGR